MGFHTLLDQRPPCFINDVEALQKKLATTVGDVEGDLTLGHALKRGGVIEGKGCGRAQYERCHEGCHKSDFAT